MRVLGLDYGSRRVGVALGDTETRLASPWTVFEGLSHDQLLEKIKALLVQEHLEKVIVGVPRSFREREADNQQIREIRDFIADLGKEGIEIEEEDEVLSSRLAAVQMEQRGEKGKRDDLAAAVILQSWLERGGR